MNWQLQSQPFNQKQNNKILGNVVLWFISSAYNSLRHAVGREFSCVVTFIIGRESCPDLEIRFALCGPSCNSLYALEVLGLKCQPLTRGSLSSLGYPNLDSLDFHFQGSVLISDDDGSRVLLQTRERTHVANRSFDRILQSNGLVVSRRDDDDFSGLILSSSAHTRSIDRTNATDG